MSPMPQGPEPEKYDLPIAYIRGAGHDRIAVTARRARSASFSARLLPERDHAELAIGLFRAALGQIAAGTSPPRPGATAETSRSWSLWRPAFELLR